MRQSGACLSLRPPDRTLLQFDTREFLNVLSLSFDEDVFTSELGMRQRQRIVDILLQLIVGNHLYSVRTDRGALTGSPAAVMYCGGWPVSSLLYGSLFCGFGVNGALGAFSWWVRVLADCSRYDYIVSAWYQMVLVCVLAPSKYL